MKHINRPSYSLLFNLLFCSAVAQSKAAYMDGDVILGGLFSVHFKRNSSEEEQCGPLYTKGLGRTLAMIFAIEKINNDSKLLPNTTLGYDIRDYCESVTRATRVTYDLVKDRCCTNMTQREFGVKKSIVAIIGPYESRTALVIGGCLQMFNISGISGTTTSPELSLDTYKSLYRTAPTDTFLAKAMVDVIEHFKWTYVAAVGLEDSYGKNGVWALTKEAVSRQSPFCVAFAEFVPLKDPLQSIREIVGRLRQHENIRVTVVWLYGSYEQNFYREVKRQNLTGRVWVLSHVSLSSSAFTLLDGSIGFQPHDPLDGGFKEYVQTYFTAKKNGSDLPEWWSEIQALKQNCPSPDNAVKNDQTQDEFCSHDLAHHVYASNVPYIIDAVYAIAHALDLFTRYNNTKNNCSHKPDMIDLQKFFSRVNFAGLTGNITFDYFGDRESASYDIVNFQKGQKAGEKRLKRVVVGKWEDSKPNDTNRLHFFKDIMWNTANGTSPKSDCLDQCSGGTRKSMTSPCCWQCIPCLPGSVNPTPGSLRCNKCPRGKHSNENKTNCVDLPLANLKYSSAGGIVISVFAICGVIATVFSFAVICKWWDTPIVRASNRELSVPLLAGILLLLSLVFINLLEPTNIICKMIYPWRYVTYNLCLAILLVKILSISKAFRVSKVCCFTANSLNNRKKAVIAITLHVLLLLLLLAWFLFDSPIKVANSTVYTEHYIFIECKAHRSSVGQCLFLLTSSYILVQTFLCAFCSFKIRNIPENFSEAKRISFSMYIFLFSLLAYQPVEFALHGWYVTVVDCVTTLLSAYGFLCCIFLPKMYIILFRPKLNSSCNIRQEVSQYTFGPGPVRVNPVPDNTGRKCRACLDMDNHLFRSKRRSSPNVSL